MINQVQAITSGGIDMYPQWSPDDTIIIFESNNYGQTDIMSISVPRSDKS
jgi:Tol biopolymer transport system component